MAYGPCQTSSMHHHPTLGVAGTTASTPATDINTIHSSHFPTLIISLGCPATHSIAIAIAMPSLIHSCYSIQFSEILNNISLTNSNDHTRDLMHALGIMIPLALDSHLGLAVWEGCYVVWACLAIWVSQVWTLGLDRGADVQDGVRRAEPRQPSTALRTVNGRAWIQT